MKNKSFFILLFILLSVGSFAISPIDVSPKMDYSFNPILSPVKYGVEFFKEENHGNHRAVVIVDKPNSVVYAPIEWRRHDENPKSKGIIVENDQGQVVPSMGLNISQMTGDILFKAKTSGKYYIYFMPYIPSSVYSQLKAEYLNPPTDEKWFNENKLDKIDLNKYPKANQIEIQSRDTFNSMYFMEVPASGEEVALLEKTNAFPYMIFAEDRLNHIKMKKNVPYKWYKSGEVTSFQGIAQPNEIYTFQIGIYAKEDLNDLTIVPSDFIGNNEKILSKDINCINTSGNNIKGEPFTKTLNIAKGSVQPLWFYVQIPRDGKGWYKGTITIKSKNNLDRLVNVKIGVKGDILEDGGVSDLWRMSRLSWLDSKKEINDDLIYPFTPIKVVNNKAEFLNRNVEFGNLGFPNKIVSNNINVLQSPFDFNVVKNGNKVLFNKKSNKTIVKNPGAYEFENISMGDNLELKVICRLEYDGMLDYKVILTNKSKDIINLDNVSLDYFINKDIAKYSLGFGLEGCEIYDYYKYSMNPNRLDYYYWLGDVDAGLQIYLKPNDNQYKYYGPTKEELLNRGWYNRGLGYSIISKENNNYKVSINSDKKELKEGEECSYNFRLAVTPFKPLDNRFFTYVNAWPNNPIGKIIHLHHGDEPNRYINYPFLQEKDLIEFAKKFRNVEIGKDENNYPIYRDYDINLYYTSRELTNHCYEIWALASLGDEVFDDASFIYTGDGVKYIDSDLGGYQWLYEHLQSGYVGAWHYNFGEDHCAAVATKYYSRWLNYYVEGLDYIMKKTGIYGLYLDGIGYDREIMKRVAKVMYKNNPNYRIEFHAQNYYINNESRSNVYGPGLEHFPYITNLWTGECFHYKGKDPAYWLIEMSGLPFGVRGFNLDYYNEIEDPYKPMLFSMNDRSRSFFIDVFEMWYKKDIINRKLFGYWNENNPVKTNDKDVLVTSFVKDGSALISVVNFSKESKTFSLDVDYKKLNINKPVFEQVYIKDFQEEKIIDNNFTLEPDKGIILDVRNED